MMKTIVAFSLTVIFTMSCGVKPNPVPLWTFERDALKINYLADSALNSFDGESHTIVVAIYQLSGLDAFNDLSKNEKGLKKLLASERFDRSVLDITKLIIQPGERNQLILDRCEDARWIGIVAGYYNLVPGQVTRTAEIPFTIREEKGIFRKKKTAYINHLVITVMLSAQTVQMITDSL